MKLVTTLASVMNFRKPWILILFFTLLNTKSTFGEENHLNITTSDAQSNNFTYSVVTFECPSLCKCTYESDSQHLKISCYESSSHLVPRYISLTGGVRKLGISHAVISKETLKDFVPVLSSNTLIELSLHSVSMQPFLLLNSDIFRKSKSSLRKIRMHQVHDFETSSQYPGNIKTLVPYFSNLQKLDSLTMTDSSSLISTVFLNGLPELNHITVFNSGVQDLQPAMFSDMSRLLTLNLSSNIIESIPWGMFTKLKQLRTLDLSENKILHLQEEIFVGLTSLHKLNVSNNMIRYIDTEVFNPLKAIHTIDLSGNEVIQIFEPYFKDNIYLRHLIMVNTWAKKSFLDPYTASRSLMEMDRLIDTLQSVETFDLRSNEMQIIPETLTHLPRLKNVYLSGNEWKCSCNDRWVTNWISTSDVLIDDVNDTTNIWCKANRTNHQFSTYIESQHCRNPEIIAKTPKKYYGIMGGSQRMECHVQRGHNVTITWLTPQKLSLTSSSPHEINSDDSYTRVLKNGDLYISNLTLDSYGLYICTATYSDLNITHYVHLGMDTSIFLSVKLVSIIVGWLTSFGFLLSVLIIQLVRHILSRFGIECPSVSSSYNPRHVRRFFENMEQHKNSQLMWLRDNYNMQAKKIKDNCMSQVERIRESYSNQTKNLSDIRDYGAHQLHTVRDQYYDQVRKVSSYSAQQLCRVRENYIFQRTRVGKFSSHQLLKIRETYKWQAQTLNKVLENLPSFDACRGVATCGRTDSIYLDDLNHFAPSEVLLCPNHLENHMHLKEGDHISLVIQPELTHLISEDDLKNGFLVGNMASCSPKYVEDLRRGSCSGIFELPVDNGDIDRKNVPGPSTSSSFTENV